jgi:hypothetical protein
MNPFFHVYISIYIAACLTGLLIYLKERKAFARIYRGYLFFLFRPWKISTFIIATAGLTVIAPYTGDPTWDYFDAIFMSVWTYFTAPWAIGTLFKFFKRELPFKHAFVAFCVWMFSASWSYDLYILMRDGYYPVTWFSNIFASSALYFLAGLLWNLDWKQKRGIIFSFMESEWPGSSTGSVFPRIFLFALPIMLFVTFLMFFFFLL